MNKKLQILKPRKKTKFKFPLFRFKFPKKFLKLKRSKKFKQQQYFFDISQKPVFCPHIWQNQWKNLQLIYTSLHTGKLIQKFLINDGLYVNKFYIQNRYNEVQVLVSSLGIFKAYKAKINIKNYRKKLTNKEPLSNLAKLLLQRHKVTYVKLRFYHIYLPKKLVLKKAIHVFKKYKRERFFWQSLQLVYGVFKGYTSANVLKYLIYTHTRRNPRRLAFVAYIKRLLDWHFRSLSTSTSKIQGVRIEIKGRFNAKSRAKKQILSTGRVRIHEISSNVDYTFIDTITKFGCLGVKIWLCPKIL